MSTKKLLPLCQSLTLALVFLSVAAAARAGVVAPPGNVACCFPSGGCQDLPPSQCTAFGGAPSPAGTTCANTSCTVPQACCTQSGGCVGPISPAQCAQIGGYPGGVGTNCQSNTCAERPCCLPDGTCVFVSPQYCTAHGGSPGPLGGTCPATCPPPTNCGPTTDGSACLPVVCPDANDTCQPKKVIVNSAGQTKILECGCGGPNDCHVQIVTGATPSCVGTCPPGQICHQNITQTPDGTIYECRCDPDTSQCAPTTDGQQCLNTICPAATPGKCKPHCVNWFPPTNSYQIQDCECIDPNTCYVDLSSLTAGVPPHCSGTCPPGFTCHETRTPLADGSETVCCDCVPQTQDWPPNAAGTACMGICPNGLPCSPKKVTQTSSGGFVITECGCDDPNTCHIQWQPGTAPVCVSTCPDATQTCIPHQVQTPLGITWSCECTCDPAKCNDGDPCTDDFCDPTTNHCVHVQNNQCQACCFTDGTCQNLPATTCSSLGGTPKGAGTDCSTVVCFPPLTPKFRQPPTPGQDDLASNIDVNDLQPNIVHADDFQSDGRPIVLVRWWGSYLNPEYMPVQYGGAGTPPFMIDGWFISFHEPIKIPSTTTRPPLGLYFATADVVKITATSIAPCDNHKIFQYEVRIDQCCLVCANPDSRTTPAFVPAQCDAFREQHCYMYDIDIQAVVGRKYTKGTGACPCIVQSTQNSATGDFWGWHATATENGARQAVRTSLTVAGLNCPAYGPWTFAQHVCTNLKRPNMAFALHTSDPTVPPPCTRACCLTAGGCVDVTTASQCQGVLQPVGSTCANTVCPQPPCQPKADGSACEDVACPDGTNKCKPKKVLITSTGQIQVLDCGCAGSDDCHVELTPPPVQVTCAGTCPAGQVCRQITTTTPTGTQIECRCEDDPTLCEPTTDRLACTNAICPQTPSGACQPHCVTWNPATNSYQVVDCKCVDPSQCHVDVSGIPQGIGPHCTANCPAGFICHETRTQNADGSITFCCDCVQDQDCGPNAAGTACNPVACPVAGQQCIPKKITGTAASGFTITECGCDDPNKCHLQWQPGTLPFCVGTCPDPTQTCITQQVQTPLGITYSCNCVCDPAKCDDGNPCTSDTCDPTTGKCVHLANQNCQACCIPGQPCQNLPPQTCQAQGGTPQGAGTDCTTVSCPPPVYLKFSQKPTNGRDDLPSNIDPNSSHASCPNIVHADDFQSDGRPIVVVRWWGSYLNPEFVPPQFTNGSTGNTPFAIDGWLISFHQPLRVIATGAPAQPLGLYFAPAPAVTIRATTIPPCDNHAVYEYEVRIDKCCLLCANPDTRDPTGTPPPARCDAFYEEHCFMYDIDIEAVVGRSWSGGCGNCLAVSTQNHAISVGGNCNFWGWHTSATENGFRQAIKTVMSNVNALNCPTYGPWSYATPVCTYTKRENMAFELLTSVQQVPAPCPQACCLSSGVCVDVPVAQCQGTPQGVGTSCATTLCIKHPHVIKWNSVRLHGTVAATALPIMLNPLASGNGLGGPTTEPRSGGIQRIEVDFDQAVNLVNPAAITTTGRTTSYPGGVLMPPAAYTPSAVFMVTPTKMAILYTPPSSVLPDATCYNYNVFGSVQNAAALDLEGDTDCNARALVGDSTSDGSITLSDGMFIKSKWGAAVASYPQCDINLSGVISLPDSLASKALVAKPPHKALCP